MANSKNISAAGFVLLLSFICINITNGQQQSGFSKTYNYPHDSIRRTDVLFSNFLYNPNSKTFIFPSNSNDNNFYDLDYWRKTDYQGNTLLHKTEIKPNATVYYNQQLSFLGDDYNSFLSAGIHFQANDSFFTLFLQKVDTNLQTQWYKEYATDQNRANIAAIIPVEDGNNIIVGYLGRNAIDTQYPAQGNIAFLLKVDSSGNKIWQKGIDSFAYNSVWGAVRAHDGNIIMCGRTSGYGISDNGSAWVMKVDTAGNKLWHKTYNLPGYDLLEKITVTADGNYICVGGTILSPQIQDMPRSGGRALKIDEDGEIIWDKIINDNPRGGHFWTVVPAPNGDIVAFGTEYKYYADEQYNYQVGSTRGPDGWAVRLDVNGNEVWNRVFGHNSVPDAEEYLYNAVALNDGGFVASGTTFTPDTFWQQGQQINAYKSAGWLVKLDANGCVDTACSEILGTGMGSKGSPQHELSLYPNPSNGKALLKAEQPLPPNTQISITDIMGRTVWQTTISPGSQQIPIDISHQPSGVYLIRLQADGWVYSLKYVVKQE